MTVSVSTSPQNHQSHRPKDAADNEDGPQQGCGRDKCCGCRFSSANHQGQRDQTTKRHQLGEEDAPPPTTSGHSVGKHHEEHRQQRQRAEENQPGPPRVVHMAVAAVDQGHRIAGQPTQQAQRQDGNDPGHRRPRQAGNE